MPDHSEQSDFERRLTDELARHAEVARDPRPTGLVAAEAMRLGRRRTGHVRLLDRRRLLLAAVLIVPAALAVAGATLLRPTPATTSVPSSSARPAMRSMSCWHDPTEKSACSAT